MGRGVCSGTRWASVLLTVNYNLKKNTNAVLHRSVLSNPLATSHMQLFKLTKVNQNVQFSSSVTQPHVAGGYRTRQSRERTFPSERGKFSWKAVMDCPGSESVTPLTSPDRTTSVSRMIR